MAEALFASGGSYDAGELRMLISSIFRASGTGGVISGMSVTPGVGLNVVVAPGYFIVNDGAGGAYLGYPNASTVVAISGNTSGSPRTDTIYGAIDATSGAVTISKVTGGTGIPANATRLASVTVPNSAASLTAANISNNPGAITVAGSTPDIRYLRKDQADVLAAGSTIAANPTSALGVAPKQYVDAQFSDTGWVDLAVVAGWTKAYARYRVKNGMASVTFNLTRASWPAGATVATLPVGVRPSINHTMVGAWAGVIKEVNIATSGLLTMAGVGGNTGFVASATFPVG